MIRAIKCYIKYYRIEDKILDERRSILYKISSESNPIRLSEYVNRCTELIRRLNRVRRIWLRLNKIS